MGDYQVELGDCIVGMRLTPCTPKLIIADSPYNQGAVYDAYDDNKSYDEFFAFTSMWLREAVHILDKHGSLWVFAPDEWVSEIDILCRKTYELYKRGHIVWAFTFGQAAQNNFSRSHCHVLYFTKTKTKFTFNHEPLRVMSARQAIYNDKRAKGGGKMPDDTWMLLKHQLEPYMTPDTNTWLVSRICGTFKERRKHSPNQIPVPLMERIVLACSNPGDMILDPFCGSGSSGVAAALHGRRFFGYDISKECVEQSLSRVAAALAGVEPS